MDKKGFTLVELLGVIAIVGALVLTVSVVVTSTLKNSKSKLTDIQIKNIEIAAKAYYLKEGKVIENETFSDCVSVNYLIENDYIESGEIKNPIDNDKMLGSVKITYDSKKYKYTYQEEECFVSKSFAEDSWETIAANVKAGNLSKYNVGDTKEITLTSEDEEIAGTYQVRIANTSTPSECNTSGFSQTACGFVVEFVDIISYHQMNFEDTNIGGWEASEMRSYVNNEIYNAFPEELRKLIIDTYVVSGHENGKTENYKTTDKIYLLSTGEIWAQGTSNQIEYDTARDVTRQLDYYKQKGVTTSNYGDAIKNGGTWWLRSALSDCTDYSYGVSNGGYRYNYTAEEAHGVAVAFRL